MPILYSANWDYKIIQLHSYVNRCVNHYFQFSYKYVINAIAY